MLTLKVVVFPQFSIVKALRKNPVPETKQYKEALGLFSKMIDKNPKPSVGEFNQLFGPMVGMSRYATVVSHDACSFNILIKCFRVLGYTEAIVATMEKQGYMTGPATYNKLVDAHCKEGMVSKAEGIVATMRKQGISPDLDTYCMLALGLMMRILYWWMPIARRECLRKLRVSLSQ
ncbi:hypothetical protein V6N12_047994 [Hibiscus sabdariffa]|uniref:Pentatricopeptide repeat-containing protein n=1 Tax=Hibiscus sabdariffa TaxID=183260 RepID=A0ABR2CUK1_9ROSI